MTDDQQNQATPAADDKDPLDVLEELLKDSGGGGAPPAKPGELTEAELAQKRADFEEKKAEQLTADAKQLAQQQELLKTLTDTPQYKARVQQDEEKAEEDQQTGIALDGFEITQLDHDKV